MRQVVSSCAGISLFGHDQYRARGEVDLPMGVSRPVLAGLEIDREAAARSIRRLGQPSKPANGHLGSEKHDTRQNLTSGQTKKFGMHGEL